MSVMKVMQILQKQTSMSFPRSIGGKGLNVDYSRFSLNKTSDLTATTWTIKLKFKPQSLDLLSKWWCSKKSETAEFVTKDETIITNWFMIIVLDMVWTISYFVDCYKGNIGYNVVHNFNHFSELKVKLKLKNVKYKIEKKYLRF